MEDAIRSKPLQRGATATAIVFEKRPRWGPELERQFAGEGVTVVECRSLRDVAERSVNVERGVIVLDLSAGSADCLQFLGRRLGEGAALPVFVVGSEPRSALEWSARELGATAFLVKSIPGHDMADLCRRQWTQRA